MAPHDYESLALMGFLLLAAATLIAEVCSAWPRKATTPPSPSVAKEKYGQYLT